jgi:hypothetical protein
VTPDHTIPRRLHDIWCRESGISLPYGFDRECAWAEWLKYVTPAIRNSEWPDTDPQRLLLLVMRRRRRKAATKPEIIKAWLAFGKVTRNPDQCVEEWAEDMAESRPRTSHPPAKQEVLAATGRPTEPPAPEPRPTQDIISGFLTQLRQIVGPRKP